MNNTKTVIRFFTIADYEEEEIWLREQHKQGWKFSKMILPCFFIFEKCTPEDVIYRLDYKNNTETSNYFQIFQDYGWEYVARCMGWLYFRKPASNIESEQDGEIFSDNESRISLIDSVIKTRLLPVTVIFFCCLLPNLIKSMDNRLFFSTGFTILFGILTMLYLFLVIHCSVKLKKLKKKYKNE